MNRAQRKERQRKIRSLMVRKGIVAADIARTLGVTRQHVTLVIAGDRYSQRVVDALVEAGVPRELLALEDDNDNEKEVGCAAKETLCTVSR